MSFYKHYFTRLKVSSDYYVTCFKNFKLIVFKCGIHRDGIASHNNVLLSLLATTYYACAIINEHFLSEDTTCFAANQLDL